MEAFGMIETRGLVASIEAADTMLKAANVRLYSKQKIGGGRVTVLICGDVGAVKSAVDAGVAAVEKLTSLGTRQLLLSSHVIPRPSGEILSFFSGPKLELTDLESQKDVSKTEAKTEAKTSLVVEKTEVLEATPEVEQKLKATKETKETKEVAKKEIKKAKELKDSQQVLTDVAEVNAKNVAEELPKVEEIQKDVVEQLTVKVEKYSETKAHASKPEKKQTEVKKAKDNRKKNKK